MRLLTKEDLCKLLQVNRTAIDSRVRRGIFPQPIKIGKCVRWREDIITRWIEAGCPERFEERKPVAG